MAFENGLGAFPSSPAQIVIKKGEVYTLVIQIPKLFKTSATDVRQTIDNTALGKAVIDVVRIDTPLFTNVYSIVFKSRINTNLDKLINLFNINFKDKWPNINYNDFSSGVELAKGFTPVIGNIFGGVKTIAYVALAGMALFYLGPMLKSGSKIAEKRYA